MMQHPSAATAAPPALTPTIPVELFGVPRLVAGARAIDAAGSTLAELAADLLHRQPTLAARVLDPHTGWPLDGYSFVVDEQFTRDRTHPLRPESSVLLVASAAGG
jgi:molybdopterin converting factor small subunit